MSDRYEELLKKLREQSRTEEEAEVALVRDTVRRQQEEEAKSYEEEQTETTRAYQQLIDENRVQQLIDKKQIAENMASLGLTDSGLNRTQQTAVELSHGNAYQKLSAQKRAALDKLVVELRRRQALLEDSARESENEIRAAYAANAQKQAATVYRQELDQQAAIEKERLKQETEQKKLAAQEEQARQKAAAAREEDRRTLIKQLGNYNTPFKTRLSYWADYLQRYGTFDPGKGVYVLDEADRLVLQGYENTYQASYEADAAGKSGTAASASTPVKTSQGTSGAVSTVPGISVRDDERTLAFKEALMSEADFKRRNQTVTIDGKAYRYKSYFDYVHALCTKWFEENKLSPVEVAIVEAYYAPSGGGK